jgi:hypothetical protein
MVPQRFLGTEEVRMHTFCFVLSRTFFAVIIMLNLLLCRYEGERSVEALAEFVNSEAGRPRLLLRTVLNHVVLFSNYQDNEAYILHLSQQGLPLVLFFQKK